MDKKNSRLEKHLESLGHRMRNDAARSREAFVDDFETRLASSTRRQPGIGIVGRLKLFNGIPRWGVAVGTAAILAVAVLSFQKMKSSEVGFVAHESGGLVITGKNAAQGMLTRGTTLQTRPESTTLASLDDDRVMVYMDGDSRLVVGGRNNVSLENGSMWFSIRPNSGRFTVTIPEGTITVHGTSFAVEIADEGSSVFLANGSISLAAGGETIDLEPDELTRVSFGSPLETRAIDGEKRPAWISGLYTGFQFAYNSSYFPSSLPVVKRNQSATSP